MLIRRLSVLALVAGLTTSWAAIRPSFNLRDCGWNATDVLVISQTADRSIFRVDEVIKGDTPIGTLLDLDDLAPPDRVSSSLRRLAEGDDLLGRPFYVEVPPIRADTGI